MVLPMRNRQRADLIRTRNPRWFDGLGNPSIETLRDLIECDALAGTLIWKARSEEYFEPYTASDGRFYSGKSIQERWNRQNSGRNCVRMQGSLGRRAAVVDVFYVGYKASTIVFALTNGMWPTFGLSLSDGDPTNIKIENIVSKSEAMREVKFFRRSGASVYTGVCYLKRKDRWSAYISVEGKQVGLGTFRYEHQAADAYDHAALKYFGPTAYLNEAVPPEGWTDPDAPKPRREAPELTAEQAKKSGEDDF